MSDDLVKRLRDPSLGSPRWMDTMTEAADRIVELEAALKDMAKHVWRGDWDKLKPETRAILEPKE